MLHLALSVWRGECAGWATPNRHTRLELASRRGRTARPPGGGAARCPHPQAASYRPCPPLASSVPAPRGAPDDQKAFGPPPTKVGQLPQPSTTVRGTVVACPTVAWWTVKVVNWVSSGRVMVRFPENSGVPATSISALVAAPNCSCCRRALPPAATVTLSWLAPAGWTVTRTAGRGEQTAVGVGVAVGAPTTVGVAVAPGLVVGVGGRT